MKKTNEIKNKYVEASIARPQHPRLDQNKGITLIALVITIVVMLILVGVTINMAVNGGLFTHAGKAVSDTQNAHWGRKRCAVYKIKIDMGLK